MRRWVAGAAVLACVAAAGCGSESDRSGQTGQAAPGLHTGTTSQGLAVSLQAGEGGVGRVAISWVGRCKGRAPDATSNEVGQLHPEEFLLGGPLPTKLDDQRRENGVDGDRDTYLRHIEVRAEGGSFAGRLRVRGRGYNGQGRGLDYLCDSGEITFSTKPVPTPQVADVPTTKKQFSDGDFHEQLYETLSSLSYYSGGGNICASVTKRLARTLCKGGETKASRRLGYVSLGIGDVLAEYDDQVRRVKGGAVLTVYLGESRQGGEGSPEEHAVSTLRFKYAGDRRWKLDRIGARRYVRKPPPGS